ncbi:MAG TPA: DMT family transporter [Xanthobacteraceae bacterium]|nr:DMT family transporter [Xanthobacteraceae bacterium]
MDSASSSSVKSDTALGVACGAGAALCWALGFVAARHGIDVGVSPLLLALHRYLWPGLALLPFVAVDGFADLGGLGWGRGFVLALFGGLPLALLSYLGYLFVPLGHGGIIQPSCAALGGLMLARAVLKEPLPARRIAGALAIVVGLCIIGAEAMRTIGAHGVGGDLLFVAAGSFFAIFGMLVRLWRVPAMRAATITSVLSLLGLPILYFKFDNFLAAGFYENLLQAVVQGGLAGAGAIFLFTRAVVLLGASRASLFPSLVSPFVLLTGFLALGIVPSLSQLAGLLIVLIGFRLTQQS